MAKRLLSGAYPKGCRRPTADVASFRPYGSNRLIAVNILKQKTEAKAPVNYPSR
jgi:hypothetical protein